jgi:methyl halide transferase
MGTQRQGTKVVLNPQHWEDQYDHGACVWETGMPSTELCHVLAEYRVPRPRALELGCGTGASAVWLATQGFTVNAVDLSSLAIRKARRRARAAGVAVEFRKADLTKPHVLDGPFDFFFDGGCYHAVRLADREGYLQAVLRATRPGAVGLVLLGNADEPEDAVGPPVVEERQVRAEWGAQFEIVNLRPFRFDAARNGGKRYLGWSCLVKKPAGEPRSSAAT